MSNLRNDYSALETETRRLLRGQNRVLHTKPYPSKPASAYTFYAPRRFAWVHLKTRLDYLRVDTYEKWAVQAGVACNGYAKPNSANNKPGYHWDVHEGDGAFLQKVAGYLAEVCKVRHA